MTIYWWQLLLLTLAGAAGPTTALVIVVRYWRDLDDELTDAMVEQAHTYAEAIRGPVKRDIEIPKPWVPWDEVKKHRAEAQSHPLTDVDVVDKQAIRDAVDPELATSFGDEQDFPTGKVNSVLEETPMFSAQELTYMLDEIDGGLRPSPLYFDYWVTAPAKRAKVLHDRECGYRTAVNAFTPIPAGTDRGVLAAWVEKAGLEMCRKCKPVVIP